MSLNTSSEDKKKYYPKNANDISINIEGKQSEKEIKEKENNNIMNISLAIKDLSNYENIKNIISSFFNYQIDSLKDISRIKRDYKLIGEKYTKRLSFNYILRIEKLKQGILLFY